MYCVVYYVIFYYVMLYIMLYILNCEALNVAWHFI